jgi:hypothetical protein
VKEKGLPYDLFNEITLGECMLTLKALRIENSIIEEGDLFVLFSERATLEQILATQDF